MGEDSTVAAIADPTVLARVARLEALREAARVAESVANDLPGSANKGTEVTGGRKVADALHNLVDQEEARGDTQAALATTPSAVAGWAVMPLAFETWENAGSVDQRGWRWSQRALSAFGAHFTAVQNTRWTFMAPGQDRNRVEPTYDTEEDAKAAAQADYEARVLSCLSPAPHPTQDGVRDAARVLLAAVTRDLKADEENEGQCRDRRNALWQAIAGMRAALATPEGEDRP